MNNPLAYCEAHAGTGILGVAVKALEHSEDALFVSGLDTNAVITDGEQPLTLHPFRRDMDFRRVFTTIPDSISDKILKHLLQLEQVHSDHWEIVVSNSRSTCGDRGMQVCESLLKRLVGIHIFSRFITEH